ncbi:hypothetical protein [Mycobacteroides abscessus]|uniref:hypothetical protein n=1 Tax=Mycobacteroides abscessus TaxID=36809 RepID=UPI001042181C|nr:hypothetical protein [Mycobacteroides abscessus]
MFAVEETTGEFMDQAVTPERVRRLAISLAKSLHADFQARKNVNLLHNAAAIVQRDLNSGDPLKVSDA